MRKAALAASAAAAAAAVAIALALFSEVTLPEPARPDPWEYDPEAAAECERAGGDYFLGANIYVCQMPVGDEGESCTDSSQCEDLCVLDPLLYGDDDLEREGLEGRCAAFSHGCDLVLQGGRAGWMCG